LREGDGEVQLKLKLIGVGLHLITPLDAELTAAHTIKKPMNLIGQRARSLPALTAAPHATLAVAALPPLAA